MTKSAILQTKPLNIEVDIYSNKSALILFWLLIRHKEAKEHGFAINELSRQTDLSVGLVHRVVKQLEYNGLVISKGFRTGKIFFLKSPGKLLSQWVHEYHLLKKTKTIGYQFSRSISQSEEKNIGLLPALHTAATELHKIKTTNLKTKEFYLLNWSQLTKVVDQLELQEMDRGYELMLIKPYYPALLQKLDPTDMNNKKNSLWTQAYSLLTVLDLCHFPLRGIEQAESLYRKLPYFNSIAPWKEVENAIR